MKYSLDIFNFLENISSLSDSIVFLYLFALVTEEDFLSLLAIPWNSAFKWVFFFPPCLRRVYLGFLLPQLKLKYLPDPIIFGKA